MEIERFNNILEFYVRNKVFIDGNRMLNILLINKIDEVYNGETTCHKCFSIISESNKTLVLLVTDICLIYSNSTDAEIIPLLSEELEFHRFLRYTFAGTKQTILDLLIYNKSDFSEQKHLKIYKCYSTSPTFKYSEGKMQLANIDDLAVLTNMNIAFKKEYNGEIVTIDNARAFIQQGIKEDNLYVWKNSNHLCVIAQVIYRKETDYPEIGHVFTIQEKRNMGYAASLVHNLTSSLLDGNIEKCMLYTNGKNKAANSAFLKIGYENVGEYIMCYKEK